MRKQTAGLLIFLQEKRKSLPIARKAFRFFGIGINVRESLVRARARAKVRRNLARQRIARTLDRTAIAVATAVCRVSIAPRVDDAGSGPTRRLLEEVAVLDAVDCIRRSDCFVREKLRQVACRRMPEWHPFFSCAFRNAEEHQNTFS